MLKESSSGYDPNGRAGEPIIRAGVYRTEPVLVRSCRYRRTRRPSPAQDGASVAAAAGECGCQVKTANRRFRQRHEAAGLRREAIDRALGRVKIVMKRLGGRRFVMDDGAGDPGEIAIEIAYDPIHPAFPAHPLSVGVAIGPIRQSI